MPVKPDADLCRVSPPGVSEVAAGERRLQDEVLPALLQQFGDQVTPLPAAPDGIVQLSVEAGTIRDLGRRLQEQGFNLLLDLAGVDYLARAPRFEVVYHLLAYPAMMRLRLRVPVAGDKPELASVSDIWGAAAAAEREAWDMFGITFKGHPDLTRILMPDDWEGHPLRKDYPLRGEREINSTALPAEQNRFFPIRFVDDAGK